MNWLQAHDKLPPAVDGPKVYASIYLGPVPTFLALLKGKALSLEHEQQCQGLDWLELPEP